MKLHLSSLAALAVTLPILAACSSPVVVAMSVGGSGGSSSSTGSPTSTGTGGATTTSTSTGTGGGANTCVQAGGQCEPVTPGACTNGMVGDASTYSCGGGVGVLCCLPCANPCPTEGATRCAADAIQTCSHVGTCLKWVPGAECPAGEACNSDGSACITPSGTCTTDAQCGCGCGCGGGMCHCTGAIPPSCNTDQECGPACSGLICAGHQCEVQACAPGMDQDCNANPAMNSFAGACNADGTCTCKSGFTKTANGKCG